MIAYLTISQILLPFIVAIFLFLGTNKYIAYFITTITSGILSVISIIILYYSFSNEIRYYFGGWLPPLGIEFLITPINAVILNLISFSAFLTFILGHTSFFNNKDIDHSFCTLFLIALVGLYGIILTNDFFNLYVFIEIASIALYALTSIGSKDSVKAAFNYLVLGTIGAVLILFGIGFLYSTSGTLNIDHFIELLPNITNKKLLSIGSYLIIVGLILKSALFPLHKWLVDLYKTTNQIILPFISSVSTKVYIFILIKLLTIVLPTTDLMIEKISVLAILGAIVTSIIATQQKTIREVLAYSSLANICYIILTPNINNSLIVASILIVNHSIVKFSLFMLTNYIIQNKKTDTISSLQMLFFDMPLVIILFIVNAASLVGIPFTLGFISKFYLLSGLINNDNWVLVITILIASFISLIYIWKIIEVTFYESKDSKISKKYINKEWILKYGILILTLINIIIGVYFISTPFYWKFN